MATLKVKWRPSIVEGRAGTIYYRIIHNRVVRQIKTNYKVFANEWDERRGKIAVTDIVTERDGLLLSIQERIDRDLQHLNGIIGRLNRADCQYTTDDIVDMFSEQSSELSFLSFMQNVIDQLKSLNKYRTAENYKTTLNSILRFRNNEDLLFDEISSDLMMQYEAYLTSCGIAKNTISFYMRVLRAVYNRAVEQNLTMQRTPFKYVYTGIDKTVKRAISFAAIKRIKNLDLSHNSELDFARDMFLFSFYTRGMSFIDMAYLKKTDLKYGTIIYRRRKTGQQLAIRWERCMQDIVSKYENREGNIGRCMPDDSHCLLPILKLPLGNDGSRYRSVLQQINKSLKSVARLADLDIPLTMYVARHSWASIARSKHIPISVISEGLGHDSEATTRIYLASLDASVIDRANSIILKGL